MASLARCVVSRGGKRKLPHHPDRVWVECGGEQQDPPPGLSGSQEEMTALKVLSLFLALIDETFGAAVNQ